ncbi:MAG: hypothetical protein ABSB28_11220 [Candidatus Bathyarchaeia archaeon]
MLKNVRAYAYSLVLNPNPKEKTRAISKKNLSEHMKDLGIANVAMLTIILITAVASGTQNLPQIVQVPLFWIGIAVIVGLLLFYIFADKKDPDDNLGVNLKILLISSYFLMGLASMSLVSYSITVWRTNLLNGLTVASITVFCMFLVTNYILSKTSQAILVSDGKERFLKTFIRLSRANRTIGFILVLTLSDAPVVIGVLIDQNISQMIYWTIGFFSFISFWLAYALRDDLRLQMEAGLIDKKKMEDDFRKLN